MYLIAKLNKTLGKGRFKIAAPKYCLKILSKFINSTFKLI